MTLPFIIGAYASMPADHAGQQQYYDLLLNSGFVSGLEVPYPGQLADETEREFLATQTKRFPFVVVTAIPGTMGNIGQNPYFGLASPNEEGRQAALEYTKAIYRAAEAIGADAVEVHSAPTKFAQREAFVQSLQEVCSWGELTVLIEHCDVYNPDHAPEKGFLSFAEELSIAKELGLKLVVNWGRSALEARDFELPFEQITQASAEGLLAGVIFSGASPSQTIYAGPWGDGHLPSAVHEPTSGMTIERIARDAQAATGVSFLGAKITVPAESSLEERVEMLRSISQAISA